MAQQLGDLITRHMLPPFDWGGEDCCLAVCNILVGMGWPDPARAYRGRYRTAIGARRVMGGTVADVAPREADRLGWPEIDPDQARDGDVGLVAHESGRRWALAIHADGWWIAKAAPAGYVAMRVAERAWRPM